MCLANDPAIGIVVASLIGVLCFFGPALALFAKRRDAWSIAGAIAFVLLAYLMPSLRMSLEGTSHDCPALGLGLLACLALYFDTAGRWQSLIASALFAVLAVWTKQVMAPLLLALPLWTGVMHGWRRGTAHAAVIVGVAVPISAFLALAIGPRGCSLNILTLPARHPWNGSFPDNLVAVAFYSIANASRSHRPDRRRGLKQGDASPSTRLAAQSLEPVRPGRALFEMPTALLGQIRSGGSVNNFSLTTYFRWWP